MAEKAWLEISIFEASVMRKYVTKSYYTILSDFGRTPFLYKSTLMTLNLNCQILTLVSVDYCDDCLILM